MKEHAVRPSSAPSVSRRTFLCGAIAAGSIVVGCSKGVADAKEERCKQCGMKIAPSSSWRTEVTAQGKTIPFDAPRCAFAALRGGRIDDPASATVRVREYYDATGPMRDARELRFAVGSDISGPMGPDLVPVDPSRATKFAQDHGADRVLRDAEITPEVLSTLR